MDATILITSYKRSNLLDFGLMSLSNHDFKNKKVEIMVLNDGLPDETEDICKKYSKVLNIKYVFTGERNLKGDVWRVPGFAFNIGAKLASSDILFFSCAEMYHFTNNHIPAMIDEITNNRNIRVTCDGKDDNGIFLNILNNKNYNSINDTMYSSLKQLPMFYPFFMGYSKHHFINIGGYDEDFIGIAKEDDDIMFRLNHHGVNERRVYGKVIHIYHPRTDFEHHERHKINYDLFRARMGIVKRNIGREWGVL